MLNAQDMTQAVAIGPAMDMARDMARASAAPGMAGTPDTDCTPDVMGTPDVIGTPDVMGMAECDAGTAEVSRTSRFGVRRQASPVARSLRMGAVAGLVLGLQLCASHSAGAAPLPNAAQKLTYHVVNQEIAGVLAGIAGQIGVRCDVSGKVQGQVHGRLPEGSVNETLNRLASLYGFDWYFDGQTLFVTAYDEAQSRVLPLGSVPADDMMKTLDAFGIPDSRWPVRVSESGGMAYVNGPPRLVNLTEGVLSALTQRAHANVTDVRVFRGASAAGS